MSTPDVRAAHQGRITTIRVPQDLYDELAAASRADSEPVAVIIRRAIAHHLDTRKADPEFRAKAAAMLARDQARIAALATPATEPDTTDPADGLSEDENLVLMVLLSTDNYKAVDGFQRILAARQRPTQQTSAERMVSPSPRLIWPLSTRCPALPPR